MPFWQVQFVAPRERAEGPHPGSPVEAVPKPSEMPLAADAVEDDPCQTKVGIVLLGAEDQRPRAPDLRRSVDDEGDRHADPLADLSRAAGLPAPLEPVDRAHPALDQEGAGPRPGTGKRGAERRGGQHPAVERPARRAGHRLVEARVDEIRTHLGTADAETPPTERGGQ